MEIIITGKQLDITDAIRDFIESKLSKLDKYGNFIQTARVTITHEHAENIVELNLQPEKGSPLHLNETHEDLYAAVDILTDKINRQVAKLKDKVKSHSQRVAAVSGPPSNDDDEHEVTYDDIIDEMGLSGKQGGK